MTYSRWFCFALMTVFHVAIALTLRPDMTIVEMFDLTVASGGALVLHWWINVDSSKEAKR